MEEPMTRKQLLGRINMLRKELQELEKQKSNLTSIPVSEGKGLEYLKATEELKERIRIKGLLRKYEDMLTKCSYEEGTSHWVEDLQNSSNLPEFSWGIREKEEAAREVILKQEEGEEGYIDVVNYGKFEYLTGESGVHIQDMPNSDYVTIEVKKFLKYKDKISILPTDINESIRQHPEYLAERLNLLRITKGTGQNQRSYFVLSPIQKKQLEDEKTREFFIKEYCSDLYLESVTKGNNGIYAGNISKSEDGFCTIKYAKSSTRAAKLAEMLPGSTLLHVDFFNGESREIPGPSETFDGIRKRLSTVKAKEDSKINIDIALD